ncbi:MAG: terminase family protein [Pseudomonadota bacterium]
MNNSALTWSAWWDENLQSRTDLQRAPALHYRDTPFLLSARDAQRPPKGDWRTWLFMGGRGAGKTRAGAEWARFSALYGGCERIALVGPTLGDVREVMIEGPSGLRTIEPWDHLRPVFSVSRRRLEWPNGAVGLVFSAEDPESLRGPQFDAAWCDEIGIWVRGETVWNNLQLGLRLGADPRCVATTTPRPVPLVQRLVGGEAVVTHSQTKDNAEHLAPGFFDQMQTAYSGTVLGRQELEGELLEDPEGAVWRRRDLDAQRVMRVPEQFDDVIIAIDPPVTSHAASDACGIIAAGRAAADGFGEKCFILADASARGLRPSDWAARAVSLAQDVGASSLVVEANQGGEMVRSVLESVGCTLPIRLVYARLGKQARAAPVAALYGQHAIAHVGTLSALEDEMCRFGAEGFVGSPDRVDALVWAVTVLMLERQAVPCVRRL